MTTVVVFLLDVDNTLRDGDRIVDGLHVHLKGEFGFASAQGDWTIFDALRVELGYVDYLGALQRYRIEFEQGSVEEQRLLMMSSFLLDYPFTDRLCARAGGHHTLGALWKNRDLDRWRRGAAAAQDATLRPARRGQWMSDRLYKKEEMLDVMKGHYALDPKIVATQPAADFTIEHIGELADIGPMSLIEQLPDKACTHQERP